MRSDDEPIIDTAEVEPTKRTPLPIPSWHDYALCAGQSTETFFGSSDDEVRPNLTITQLAKARGLCQVCPVMLDCLESALINKERYGVWAGTSGHTRARIWGMLREGMVSLDVVLDDFGEGRWAKYERGAE